RRSRPSASESFSTASTCFRSRPRRKRKETTMGRTLTNPPELHPAPGFSHIAVATGTTMVFFAGQVALDRDFNIVGGDDLHAQTVAAMRNLEVALAAAGASWDDIVRRTIYTTEPTEFETIAAAIAEVTGG